MNSEAPSIETSTPEESSEFRYCIHLAKTQQSNTTIRQMRRSFEYTDIHGVIRGVKQANISFLAKILRAKRTTIQDGRTDD